jgi:hypothetical protein
MNKNTCLIEQTIHPIPTIHDMIEKRLLKYQDQYIHSFTNTNIDWDKNSTDTGDIWKTRILCEHTHSGNVCILYNSTFQGFFYYCDATIQNRHLQLLIMKYVLMFRCRKFCISPYSVTVNEETEQIDTTATTAEAIVIVPSTPLYVKSKIHRKVSISIPVTSTKHCGKLRDIIMLPKKISNEHAIISYTMFHTRLLNDKEKERLTYEIL